MIWASWSDFVAMGGYGFFVWGSYGVTAVLMITEAVLVVRRHRGVLERLGRMARADQMKAESNESAQ